MSRRIEINSVQIDASSHCQLACQSCPTASGDVARNLGAGHLRPQQFEAMLERNPGLEQVELSNYGEMFLNPALAEILRIAFERQVILHADNGVNLNFAAPEALEALVKYRFRSMSCSIDGASPETYAQYRVKGDFERVIGHIRRINELKRQYNSGFPFLRWQFIVFGHNEHEIEGAKRLAAELGMQFYPKLSWDDDLSPLRNPDLVRIAMASKVASRAEFYQATGRDYMRGICAQLWQNPVLNWDGRVNGCCRNFWGEFGGNAFDDGLDEALNGEGLSYARDMIMGRASERNGLPCTTCDLYQVMKRDGTWMTEAEVARPKPAILCSVAVEPGLSNATHVDIFLTPEHAVNRVMFVNPPAAVRYEVGKSFSVPFNLPGPGPYTVYALPRKLDPTFRTKPAALEPVTKFIQVEPRPTAQQFTVTLK